MPSNERSMWLEQISVDTSMEDNETTRNEAASRDHMDEVPALLTLVQNLNLYYLPTLVSLGLALHVFCCVVFTKTMLRHKFFTQLFLAESVADVGFLLTLLLLWFDDRGYEIYAVPGVCPIVIFASHFFPFLSIWMSMSSAILLTLRPCVKRVNKFTADKGNGKITVICFVVFTLTAYLYKTWTNGVLVVHGQKYCTVLQEARDAMKIINVLDIILLLIIPFVGFVVFNVIVFVGRFGWHCSKFQQRKPGPQTRGSGSRDTIRVVCVESIGFILLVGPGCVSKLVFHVLGGPVSSETHTRDLLLQNLFQYLFYTYFAITPVLHISASSSFRDHVTVAMTAPQKTRSVSARVDRILRSDPISDLTLL